MNTQPATYWALFKSVGGNTFRFDTRIYGRNIVARERDAAIGAIVAKNPGSAQPSATSSQKLQAILLDGDRLLPDVWRMVQGAYLRAGLDWPDNGYVQVFNLFYLCDKDARRAKQNLPNPPSNCTMETKRFPWLWYAWGSMGNDLPQLAKRFETMQTDRRFYYDKNFKKVVAGHPGQDAFPKHTQGLTYEPMIAHIASLLSPQQF